MASVSFSGFAAPKLFISLKRSYMDPEVTSPPLSTIRYDTVSAAQYEGYRIVFCLVQALANCLLILEMLLSLYLSLI